MNQERLHALLAAYGAEPERWPAAERAAAEAALRDHPDTDGMLLVERMLDDALDAWPSPRVTLQLRERSLQGAPREGAARPRWRRVWLSGAGLAAACGAGLVAGITLIGPSLANAFPTERAPASNVLADGVSVLGAPLDSGVSG